MESREQLLVQNILASIQSFVAETKYPDDEFVWKIDISGRMFNKVRQMYTYQAFMKVPGTHCIQKNNQDVLQVWYAGPRTPEILGLVSNLSILIAEMSSE